VNFRRRKRSRRPPPKKAFRSVELMPRITRAQSMDALSSMATICGYKAVLVAADKLAPHLSHADHRCRHHHAVARAGHWRRRRRIAGHRYRAQVRCGGLGLRLAPRRQRAGAEPGRKVRRVAHRGGRRAGRRRLRQGAGRIVLSEAARIAGQGRRRERCGDHHRCGSRQEVARAGDEGDGRRDGAGLGDRRPGRGARRQLRTDARSGDHREVTE
jgi:hypothetical protein